MSTANCETTSGRVNQRQRWSFVTALLVLAIFAETIFAGAMMSGVPWARAAHTANAVVVIALAFGTGLLALVMLGGVRHGLKQGVSLLTLAGMIALQIVLGVLSAKGANLLWLHVPLGVAILGLAVLVAAGARKLGAE
jgi:hypothetical protein